MYLEIAVNVPQVSGVFHYHAPETLVGKIRAGQLVTVPFGRRTVQGVVLRDVVTPDVPETKPIRDLLDPTPVLTPTQIELATHLAERTYSSLAACIALMLPTGLSQQADTQFELIPDAPTNDLGKTQTQIVKLLGKRGPLRGRQIDRAIPRIDWRKSANSLLRRGIITSQSVLPKPTVRAKTIKMAQLIVPPNKAREAMPSLSRVENVQQRRQAILEALIKSPEPMEVAWVYATSGGNLSDLKRLDEMGLVQLFETEVWRDPLEDLTYVPSEPPSLTDDQQTAWDTLQDGIARAHTGEKLPPYLLHGVTGSGKTELYLRAVAETLARGRQAIVLVPEIALTPQTVRRFLSRFPGQVGLIHSRLSPGERYDTWRRARSGQLSVVVGPRSAIFTPFPDLGLVVVDECHDTSYYQSESPFYHGRDAAIAYAYLSNAVCILGTATPNVRSMYQAKQGRWKLITLAARILAHKETIRAYVEKHQKHEPAPGEFLYPPTEPPLPRETRSPRYHPLSGDAETTDLPPVRIVDMRQELRAGNRSIFSRALQESLGQVLAQEQQAILFLNRRGTATYVFCRDCGHVMKCPRCDEVSLTYHQSTGKLHCHHCDYQRSMPKTCPECAGTRIRQYGTGTERVEAEVNALFPEARTLRWDWETTRQKGSHEIIMNHFLHHRADVLVGTQMLAKGLDLPLVTLVGVVLADVGLHLPDYAAGERTFQTLSQVSGRAGRSPLGGQIVLQTFDPQHYVIQAVSRHDYAGFYRQELGYRRELGYPPFSELVRLEYRSTDPDAAEQAAKTLANSLKAQIRRENRAQTHIIGPAPCFFSRLDTYYRWQIVLRGPEPLSLLTMRKLANWRVEVNPPSLL